MRIQLIESKQDELKLANAVGEELAQQFLNNRKKYPSPYNDIYYWVKKDPSELADYMDSFNSIRDKKDEGIEMVYQDDDWKVFRVLTYDASKRYGAGTRWCISGTRTYKSGRTGEEYFNEYRQQGVPIYFFISPKYGKWALCDTLQGYCQIFDDQDVTVDDIPNLPYDAEELGYLTSLEPITLDRIYEDEDWTIDRPTNDNPMLNMYAIVARKGDEEDAYKYGINEHMFMDPQGRALSITAFGSIDDAHRRIGNKILTGEVAF